MEFLFCYQVMLIIKTIFSSIDFRIHKFNYLTHQLTLPPCYYFLGIVHLN